MFVVTPLYISFVITQYHGKSKIMDRKGYGSGLYTVLREYFDYYNDRLSHQGITHQIPAHRYYQAA